MADIFVSYTSADRDWAFWIGQELLKLGHTAHVHEWEISGGGDIEAWMEERHNSANHILCVVSEAYLKAPHSSRERRSAQWAIDRPNFALPVFVEDCKAPSLFANIKRCDLYGLSEDDARARFKGYLAPATVPVGPIKFPGAKKAERDSTPPTVPAQVVFPGQTYALSNIPIGVPLHFLGREDVLKDIEAALGRGDGRVAITALHGLRGVGKSTLAAAYAVRHRREYRATWWIRAQTDPTMRADIVALGVKLGWTAADTKEGEAIAAVLDRLKDNGEGILLIFDNANNAREIQLYLPKGEAARVLVTSNDSVWGKIATKIGIAVWPKDIGADYLMKRAAQQEQRSSALELSEALGGLPLAHEQAAAYCERLGITFSDYLKRFEATPSRLLDTEKDAPAEYHDRLTVAKTFALAIDEAAKLHPAAQPLIEFAALLAPEPIPLFLFSEARRHFGEPLASALADDGLDEAVVALRTFALIDREAIPDERNPSLTTDCIRLHRLVREVAAVRYEPEAREEARCILIEAMAGCYPGNVWRDPETWPRARRLDTLALALVGGDAVLPTGVEERAASLLIFAGQYKQFTLGAYAQARPLYERSLRIRESLFGPEHPETAIGLFNLGFLLKAQGDLAGARPYYERALAIDEKVYGSDHPEVAADLNNLGVLLREQGDFAGARPCHERALAIKEKALGPDHEDTAPSLNSLGNLLLEQGDLAGARPYIERALAIHEKALGPDHPSTASSLNDFGYLLQDQGDLAGARPYFERALATREKVLGPDHPDTAASLNNLGYLVRAQGDLAGARPYYERALAIYEKALGVAHPSTKTVANNTAIILERLKCRKDAKALRKKFGIEDKEKS